MDKLDQFFSLLADIVNSPRPYTDKKSAILTHMDEADKINLGEFLAWFDDGDIE